MKAQTITISATKAKFNIEIDDPVTNDSGDSFGGRKERKKPGKEIPSMIMIKNDLHPFFGFESIYWTCSYISSATEEGK